MTTLIIDTSAHCQILALTNEGILSSIEILPHRSPLLFSTLQKFCNLQEICSIAVGIGPGSFMGMRTGATIGKTLSFALSIPLYSFYSPEAFLPEKEGIYTVIGHAKISQLFFMEIAALETITILTPPTLIFEEELEAKGSIIDLRKKPLPQLSWVAKSLIKNKNFNRDKNLKLAYLEGVVKF